MFENILNIIDKLLSGNYEKIILKYSLKLYNNLKYPIIFLKYFDNIYRNKLNFEISYDQKIMKNKNILFFSVDKDVIHIKDINCISGYQNINILIYEKKIVLINRSIHIEYDKISDKINFK